MKLVIVESPGKTKKIAEILGGDFEVHASYGHIRDLPDGRMGFSAPDFKPEYQPIARAGKDTGKTIAKLASLAAKADTVYLATDPDREGEAIAWHLKDALGLKDPHRITFAEITPAAVKSALHAPRRIDTKLVAAQEMRRILDRAVGFGVSPALSDQAGQTLSAGRVQTPAVRLVVERERAIRNFKSTKHYGAMLHFAGQWHAEWDTANWLSDGQEYYFDLDTAHRISASSPVTVSHFEDKSSRRSPPAPFITSTLQQAASNRLKFSPDKTMQLAQRLYEAGLITYHRTDNPNLSDDALADLFVTAQAMGLSMADQPRTWKAKEGAQTAHEAIRPAHFADRDAGDTEDEKALYRLIWQRALACQIEDSRYAVRTIRLTASLDGKEVSFKATGRTLTHKGWLAVLDGDDTEDTQAESANPIPALSVGQTITPEKGELLNKHTKAPARYTEASLVKALDDAGIGRPSTYAAIMEAINRRGYVEIKSRQLYATAIAEKVIDALINRFSFADLDFTANMETICDSVATGHATYKGSIAAFYDTLCREIEAFKQGQNIAPQYPCPVCGKALRKIKDFWGCSGYPDCKHTQPDDKGKPGKPKAAAAHTQHKCECGAALVHRKQAAKPGKTGYDFFSCSAYPKCDKTYPNVNGKPGKANIKRAK